MNEYDNTDHESHACDTSPYSALQSAFQSQELTARDRFYAVKDEDSLVEKLKRALSQSETGARLVQMAEQQDITIHLLKSWNLQSAATQDRQVFLAAKPDQQDPQMAQLLEFGGVLREAEQILMGFTVPENDEDELEKASRIHAKYLDKISHMCRIGTELEDFYGERVYKAIEAFGYEDLYNAHKNNSNDQEIADIYRQDRDSKAKK